MTPLLKRLWENFMYALNGPYCPRCGLPTDGMSQSFPAAFPTCFRCRARDAADNDTLMAEELDKQRTPKQLAAA